VTTIEQLTALEILDSRGRPTVRCTCRLAGGVTASASVPSGASTGSAEALELRDGDPARYRGLGCRKAVANINTTLHAALRGRRFETLAALDEALIELDGTPNKARLGANALLAVSLAFARASACARGLPLYAALAELRNPKIDGLPRPMINLFSGGKHAGGQVEVQDVQIMALRADTVDEALRMTFEVFYAAADLCAREFGMRLLTADEGGLAPAFADVEAMFATAVRAIELAGLRPGVEMALTVDVAASHFYRDGAYHLGGRALSGAAMIEQLQAWLRDYPIVSIEDGLAEEDWASWRALRAAVSGKALVLGDDLLCTSPVRIMRAIAEEAADALLLKVNQIGTLAEAARAAALARAAGWPVVVSARSGETEDDWLADLATAWGDYIKVGAITQSERLAKYNRLLAIEAETGLSLRPFVKGSQLSGI